MRQLGSSITIAIVAFWLTTNSLLVWRDLEFRRQGEFKSGVDTFLGNRTTRESWMSIFQGARKVGYTGSTIEKIWAEEGIEYQVAVETLYRGRLPLPSVLAQFLQNSNQFEIEGRLFLDEELEPTSLRLDIALTILRGTSIEQSAEFLLLGKRDADRFAIDVWYGDDARERPDFRVAVPIDKMTLSNGLSPSLPVSQYEVGKRYHVAVFDPLSSLGFDAESASVEVIDRERKAIDGVRVDVFVVETKFRGQVTRSWVTASGDTLREEIGKPFDMILRKESHRAAAVRGFAKSFDAPEAEPATRDDAPDAEPADDGLDGANGANGANGATSGEERAR